MVCPERRRNTYDTPDTYRECCIILFHIHANIVVGYLSLGFLRNAVEDTEGKFCTSCYTGSYPTELVQLEVEAQREN